VKNVNIKRKSKNIVSEIKILTILKEAGSKYISDIEIERLNYLLAVVGINENNECGYSSNTN
jgi:hypothetical protein